MITHIWVIKYVVDFWSGFAIVSFEWESRIEFLSQTCNIHIWVGKYALVVVIFWISNGIFDMWVFYFVKILIIFKQQLPKYAWYMHMGGNIGVGLSTKLAIYRFGSQNIHWLRWSIAFEITLFSYASTILRLDL
jgi:hypothetical protein